MDWLIKNNIKFEPQYNFITENFNRYVDFYCKEFNLFIEIDGDYWHKDRKEEDIKKDADALSNGIKTLRISAKSRIEETLSMYFKNNNET